MLERLFNAQIQGVKTRQITFDPFKQADRIRGLDAVFKAGPEIRIGAKGVLLVPEGSLKVLRELGIPFHIVSPSQIMR